MDEINLYGAKGGVGTTVTAAILAINLGGTLKSEEANAVLGTLPDSTDLLPLVIDRGTASNGNCPVTGEDAVLVTTLCYLALRRALTLPRLSGFRGVIVVAESGRALNVEDVAGVLNLPILAVVPHDAAIARAVDAGLLGSRLPRSVAGLTLSEDVHA